ncbi:cytochrome c oxidase accessory protein CcoG [Fulvivirga sediminis]|uniref:Cytochrome c oxidase accessory protein CcoG n=1 Tax=Fulvivirga sediminis TaxID=2803949 RepID=A0A937F7X0_9BACT|nr:cytochrome c oxidase accessory protein CcoG [Fulvivirga sediminis]MBL3655924.1 cytochrome c oxidase accessory protein CcoG [Fulvivirga sediminis]
MNKKASLDNLYEYDEEFKDTIATVDAEGKRVWVYPKKPSGHYHNRRIVVTIILLSILFSGPFIRINGRPFLLLNIFERKFVILGQAFWPQDFFLLALLLITFFVFVILFTVIFGRVWCGWACPQTLFMEMVFRKIEYWIDGDANQQRKLKKAPWNAQKIGKRLLKHTIFIIISLMISHTVMAYLIGIEEVKQIVSQSPSEHWGGFIGLMVFTGIFYGVFSWFREQACVAVCPYGRLQGVLLDKKSIAVMYDWVRGEPRGKLKKKQEEAPKGDCIDCKLCVHACPTGIDIRNGTQLECVNCTACIDACNDVMQKVNLPTGLIRYSSFEAIEKGKQKIFTKRAAAYSVVLVLLLGILGFSLASRSEIETTVLKVPGQLYQRTDDGHITNLYNIQFVNKTFEDMTLELRVEDEPEAEITKVGEGDQLVPSNGLSEGVYFIKIPTDKIKSAKTSLTIGVYKDGKLVEKTGTKFLGPVGKSN